MQLPARLLAEFPCCFQKAAPNRIFLEDRLLLSAADTISQDLTNPPPLCIARNITSALENIEKLLVDIQTAGAQDPSHGKDLADDEVASSTQ